jgi:DNA polymerase III epsilon subunit-like protein
MKLLVFDTETTGLPIFKNVSFKDSTNWPHIIQLSYILYDLIQNKVICEHDHIIDVPPNITISEKSISLHGITRKISSTQGIPIQYALQMFNICLDKADIVIAHNFKFDRSMIMVESHRYDISVRFNSTTPPVLNYRQFYCTMEKSTKLCNIAVKNRYGKSYNKFPTLLELHKKLFDSIPSNLHNSFIDVIICFRCYYKIKYDQDICIRNKRIGALYRKYCKT